MEEKSLSDFDLNHIVYLAVGEHVDIDPDTKERLTLDQIVQKKSKEIDHCGMSLWAFRPQGTSERRESIPAECREHQDQNGNIFAVLTMNTKNNKNNNKRPKSEACPMHFYEADGEIFPIPDKPLMEVTATRAHGDFALFVEEYFKITDEDNILHCERYDKGLGFGFEFLNKLESPQENAKKNPRKVAYIAKLKSPFIVKVMK